MKNQMPPPSSAGSATANSDAVSLLPRRSSRRRPGAANPYSSHTDPPVSDDNSDPRSVPRRTSRLRRPGVAAAHPPEPPRNSRVRRPRRAGAAADPDPDPGPTSEPSSRLRRNSRLRRSRRSGASAAAADPDPDPDPPDDGPTSEPSPRLRRNSRLRRSRRSGASAAAADPDPDPPDDGPTSEPSSRLRRNSRLRRSRRSGASAAAADSDPEPPVYDDDGRSDDEDPTWASSSEGDPEDEDPTWVSDDNSNLDKDKDHTYSPPSSRPRGNSRLRRSCRLEADRYRQPPVSADDDPTDSLQGRNSRLRTSESPMNRRRRSHSRSLGATAADPNPVPQVSENSEFPNSDEWGATEGLLALKERAHLPPKNQSSNKPEKEMNDQHNDVRAISKEDWLEIIHPFDGKSVCSFFNEINSKEDERSCKVPAAEAEWAVKKTHNGDARILQMIKLEFDKFSSKLNQMSKDIKDIKQILLTGNSKENRNIKLQGNVAGSD